MELMVALKEEIGNPGLFTGRTAELEYFLRWADLSKQELSRSHAIMARKRRGKTALVQRLYNILYTQHDPQVIPIYYRVPEYPIDQNRLSDELYRTLISQYLAFKLRRPELAIQPLPFHELHTLTEADPILSRDVQTMVWVLENGRGSSAWEHAHKAGHRLSVLKDERIIQILDEFQFLNEHVYLDDTHQRTIPLGNAYQHIGTSKVSPLIITGSYVGWLSMIIRHMVDRFTEYFLGPYTREEALAAVYNYSSTLQIPVSDSSAAYMAALCHQDPYYIAALFESAGPAGRGATRDLSSRAAVRETLMYEITLPKGRIGKMWEEYTWHAFDQLNDHNAKKIVLYLARHGEETRGRDQIMADLGLEISDPELETLLHKLYRVDMVAQTSSKFRYQGLGDPIFEMVFRHMYEEEIENVPQESINQDIERQLKQARGRVSYYKGMAAEYRLINHLLGAMMAGMPLDRLVSNCPSGLRFGPFSTLRKKVFHLDQTHWVEVDVFGKARDPRDADLVIEVKDWAQPVGQRELEAFVQTRDRLAPLLERPTAFLFHGERGLSEAQLAYLEAEGIMASTGEGLRKAAAGKKGG